MYGGKDISLDELATEVKRSVIGQDDTVDWLCSFVDWASERSRLIMEGSWDTLDLPNIGSALLVGPTASGKSHLVKTFARAAGLYFHPIDASVISTEGYIGDTFSNHWRQIGEFLNANPGENALVLIDEVDKLMRQKDREGNARFDLLKPLEGGILRGENSTKSHSVPFELNCDRCIFILAGAFTDIEEQISQRLGINSVGFSNTNLPGSLSSEEDLRSLLELEDLEAWGVPREILGRISTVRFIPALSEETLHIIVRNLKVAEYGKMFHPVEFYIDKSAEDLLVKDAISNNYGARSINQQINTALSGPLRFELRRQSDIERITLVDDGGKIGYRLEYGAVPQSEAKRALLSPGDKLAVRSGYSLLEDVRLALSSNAGSCNPRVSLGDSCAEFAAALLTVREESGNNDRISVEENYSLAEITLLNALYALLHDWFPTKDFTPDGIRTLLSMTDVRKMRPGYWSPLDLLFREISDGERYLPKPDGSGWAWQPSILRRTRDGVEPGKCGGLSPSEDTSLGFYTEFKDYSKESQVNAVYSLAYHLL